MRSARPKDVMPSCAVEVNVNVAWDDQPSDTPSACCERGAVPCTRNGDDLANACGVNANDCVVNNLSVDQRRAANAARCN
jgi:hypothetical protein